MRTKSCEVFLDALVSDIVAAAPIVDAAGVECLAVGNVVTMTVLSHPAVTTVGSHSSSEGLVLRVIAPRASRDRAGLNDGSTEQESTEENQRLVHGVGLAMSMAKKGRETLRPGSGAGERLLSY